MALPKLNDDLNIIQTLADRPNALDGLSAAQLKQKFDEAPNIIKTFINDVLLPALYKTDDGSSGADNIGATAVTDLDGTTVQALIESIRNKLKATTGGSSGAGFIGASTISGLSGNTVQALLEALKTYIDNQDGQIGANYVSKTELTTTRKLDASGDFTGSWFGVTNPAKSDPGIAGLVELHTAQLADIAINVSTYGATGDGSDETEKIQAAIDAAGPNSHIIGAPGKIYIVRQLLVNKNNLTIRDISLKLADGDNTWAGVIKIIGTREQPASNITLRNVIIDGNRKNQTGIPVNNPTEARTGIAIFGVASNVLVENCQSNYNAGDGIWIYSRIPNGEMSGTTRTTDDDPCFRNITVRNSVFNFNRRHGGALDSLDVGLFEDCTFDNNGTDVDGGTTTGDQGETFNGNLFGNGFDLEGYGQGTAFSNITFVRCESYDNASRAISIVDATSSFEYDDFSPRGHVTFKDCRLRGVDTEGYVFYISPSIANRPADPRIFTDIRIESCFLGDSKILYQSVDGGSISQNVFETSGTGKITIDNSNDISIYEQIGIISSSVFLGTAAVNINRMMEKNDMLRAIISVSSPSNLPSSAPNGTLALITSPSSGNVYAWIMQGGAWRPFAQQIGPTTIAAGSVPGAQNKYVPIRDTDGTLLGYIPIYS